MQPERAAARRSGRLDGVQQRLQRLVGRRPGVDRQLHAAGHDVRRRSGDAHVARGDDGAGDRQCDIAQRDRELGGGEERVAASRHRRRPRVAGVAVDGRRVAGHPGDRADDRVAGGGALEHRALLDVHLDERAGQRAGHRRPSRPSSSSASRTRMPSASADSSSSSVTPPHTARLPKKPRPKRQPSSSRKATTASGAASGVLPRAATASSAASTPSAPSNRPPPGTVSRCEPGPHLGDAVAGARPAGDQVAGGVPRDGQSLLLAPLRDQLACALLVDRQAGPGGAPALAVGADLRELREPLHGPRRPVCDGVHRARPRGLDSRRS